MAYSLSGIIYKVLIDPFLAKLHDSIIVNLEAQHSVLDVACGTGSLSIAISKKASEVKGIDMSEDMIDLAKRSVRKKGIKNARFEIQDASDLPAYADREFDIAVTSMAIHQFDASLAIKILEEMKRIASKVIILDYNYQMPAGLFKSVIYGIERFAGGDHYRNFRVFIERGGLHYFINSSGLTIRSEASRGKKSFKCLVCD